MWEVTLVNTAGEEKSTLSLRHVNRECIYVERINASPEDIRAGTPCRLRANDDENGYMISDTTRIGVPWTMSTESWDDDKQHALVMARQLCSQPDSEQEAANMVWERLVDKMRLTYYPMRHKAEFAVLVNLYSYCKNTPR